MDFGEKLKSARAVLGLSQQALADRTRISKRAIEDWERGLRNPPPHVEWFLLNYLNPSLEFMAQLEENRAKVEQAGK